MPRGAVPTPPSRCRRRRTSCRCPRRTPAPAAPACSSASRTRRSRASGRWSSTSSCRRSRRAGAGRRLPARRRLAARQPARRRPGVPRRVADPVRAARAGRASPSPASTTGSPARRPGPAQLHDAKAAVRWLRARADDLGIDPDRIAAWGESAGGHLAELLGLTGDDAALEGDVGITGPSSRVSAVVAWYAPSDLAAVRGRHRRRPDGPRDAGGAAARRARRRRCPSSPRRPARSPTSPPAPRRSCCCTARPTGSSRPCRASGCYAALRRGRGRGRAGPVRGRRPHVARVARGRAAGARPHDRRPAPALRHPGPMNERRGQMRIVGIRRDGGVEVASLSDDGTQVTVVAGLEEFWADAAGHLSREPAGETRAAPTVEFVPPVLPGARVICIGLNYLKHVAEGSFRDQELPAVPDAVRPVDAVAHRRRRRGARPVQRGRPGLGGRGDGLRRRRRWSTPPRTRRWPPSSATPASTTSPRAGRRSSPASGSSARTATTPARSARWSRPPRSATCATGCGCRPGSTARSSRTAAPTRWSTPSATPSR